MLLNELSRDTGVFHLSNLRVRCFELPFSLRYYLLAHRNHVEELLPQIIYVSREAITAVLALSTAFFELNYFTHACRSKLFLLVIGLGRLASRLPRP